MQSSTDFLCVDCRKNFDCASELLKHFAQHVTADALSDLRQVEKTCKKSNVPDLYPISFYKRVQNGDLREGAKPKDAENFNPLRFCEVTMDDDPTNAYGDIETDSDCSDYKCKYCSYSCGDAALLRSHVKYHKRAKSASGRIPDLSPMKIKSRKQEKCNIKRKMYGTKFSHQSNELLCT